MSKLKYSFTVLQYRHDAWTGECINVGLLFFCPEANILRLKARRGGSRVSDMFPGVNRGALLSDMKELERYFAHTQNSSDLFWEFKSARDYARVALKDDDSGFAWFLDGSGVTSDPSGEMDRLFNRLVMTYDPIRPQMPRTDDEVFETVKTELKRAELLKHVTEHTISSDVSELTFDHAIKNGRWHCIQALSFDSADEVRLRRKAHRWAGALVGIKDATPDFQVYLVAARPQSEELMLGFNRSLELLRRAPTEPIVVEEAQAAGIVQEIASLH